MFDDGPQWIIDDHSDQMNNDKEKGWLKMVMDGEIGG